MQTTDQMAEPVYSKSHIMKIMGLDALTCIIGLVLAASPFAMRHYPGDIDTTVHVALGALIATPAAFRMLVAYGSLWVEVVLFFLGLIVLRLPAMMNMQWDGQYRTAHLAAGAAIMVLSVISLLLTIPVLKKK